MSQRFRIRGWSAMLLTGLTTVPGAQAQDAITSTGRWRATPPTVTTLQRQTVRSGSVGRLMAAPGLSSMALTSASVLPVVSSQEDMALLLTGGAGGANLHDRLMERMQIVPEVPSRFNDSRFDEVRQALNPCMASAAAYRNIVLSVAGGDDIEGGANSFVAGEAARSYERDCMTRLADVPSAVRQITGVLIDAHGVPWCSATIVGSHRLLTARHCFIHAADGSPTQEYDQVAANLVGFVAAEAHGGRHNFDVAWVGDHAPSAARFSALEDLIVLGIRTGAFDHFVRPGSQNLPPQQTPLPVWVVGSNAHLGDLGAGRSALEFTRASAPKACAIVQVTANGCIYHTCQTGPATSGAGLLALTANGTATLLGVHKARISEAGGCESTPPVGDALNLAIHITSQQIE